MVEIIHTPHGGVKDYYQKRPQGHFGHLIKFIINYECNPFHIYEGLDKRFTKE